MHGDSGSRTLFVTFFTVEMPHITKVHSSEWRYADILFLTGLQASFRVHQLYHGCLLFRHSPGSQKDFRESLQRDFDLPVSTNPDFCSYRTKILCILQLVSLVYLRRWGWGHWALSNAVLAWKCFLEQIKNWSHKIISEFLLKESKLQWKYWPKCPLFWFIGLLLQRQNLFVIY